MILAAVAALTLASCAKFETSTVSENDGNMPIGFTNYAPKSLTKASTSNYASGNTLVNGAHFAVWGWSIANANTFAGSGTAFFSTNNTWYDVTYSSTNGGAGTDGSGNTYNNGARYWPSGDTPDKLSFYAYYPSNAGTITAPNGLGAFEFTAEDTAAAQVDFMVADVVPDQIYGSTNASPTNKGTVDLTFRHQLTKVMVKFKTTSAIANDANTSITVNSAEFGHIKNSGDLTASYQNVDNQGRISGETGYDSSSAALGTATRWSDVDGDASYDIAVPASALTAVAANSNSEANDIFLLVPQVMIAPTRNGSGVVTNDATAQYIDVEWTVTTNGVDIVNSKRIYLDECVSTDGGNVQANIDWEKNHFVTYTITIAPKQILFTGAVASWEDVQNGYFDVQ